MAEELASLIHVLQWMLFPWRNARVNDRHVVAIHEAGHAVVYQALGMPVFAIRIHRSVMKLREPPKGTLGYVAKRRKIRTQKELLCDIVACLGGVCAEEICLGTTCDTFNGDHPNVSEDIRRYLRLRELHEKEEPTDVLPWLASDSLVPDSIRYEMLRAFSDIALKAKRFAKQIVTENRATIEKLADLVIEKRGILWEEQIKAFFDDNSHQVSSHNIDSQFGI